MNGSVHRDDRDNCAYLKVWDDEPKLNANRNTNANPNYGTLVFRRDCLENARVLLTEGLGVCFIATFSTHPTFGLLC